MLPQPVKLLLVQAAWFVITIPAAAAGRYGGKPPPNVNALCAEVGASTLPLSVAVTMIPLGRVVVKTRPLLLQSEVNSDPGGTACARHAPISMCMPIAPLIHALRILVKL